MRWSTGEAAIERLLGQGSVERVQGATERASAVEAAEALKTAEEIIDAVTRLLPSLGFF